MFNKVQDSKTDIVRANPLTMEIQTPRKTNNVKKRAILEVADRKLMNHFQVKGVKFKGRKLWSSWKKMNP